MSFKKVSADQAGELRRTFDPKEYLGVALTSLRFQWKNRPVEVILQGPEGLECDSYPGAVAQVVTNLMTNLLGGTITFASTPRAGTRFDILLPKTAPFRG